MPTETELVALAVRRDAAAFGRLYQIHLDSIYRYIYYRVANATEAEDLTEQVFLKAWEHLAGYDQRGLPFASWLYRMAHNLVVDYHRTRRPTESLDRAPDGAETPGGHWDRPGPEEQVERRLDAAEVAAALRDAQPGAAADHPAALRPGPVARRGGRRSWARARAPCGPCSTARWAP